jgi:HSP90 family molecular chaperone
VTQGTADLAQIPRLDDKDEPQPETAAAMATFLALAKTTLGDAVADVRISDRRSPTARRASSPPSMAPIASSSACSPAPDASPLPPSRSSR